jgi:hypothetical protein
MEQPPAAAAPTSSSPADDASFEREFRFALSPNTSSSNISGTWASTLIDFLLHEELLPSAGGFLALVSNAGSVGEHCGGHDSDESGSEEQPPEVTPPSAPRTSLSLLPMSGDFVFSWPRGAAPLAWRLEVSQLPQVHTTEGELCRKLDVLVCVRARSVRAASKALGELIEAAHAYAESLRGDPKRTVYVRSSSGDARIPCRELSTIFLPDAIKLKAREEVASFLRSRGDYLRFGIPYRRTFLLTGNPGLGKTSLIHALASEFKRDIFIISVGPKSTDESLYSDLRSVRRGTFVVLEDVDALFTANREIDRERSTHAVSFSGLLNALDGLTAPSGVLLFLTTNHLDRLDPGLLRPGRVDSVFHFEPPGAAQVADMLQALLPNMPAPAREVLLAKIRAAPACKQLSTAVLQKWLFDHRASAEPPVEALVALCEFHAERAAAGHRTAPEGLFG